MSGSGNSPRPQEDTGNAHSGSNNAQTRMEEARAPRTEQELAQAFKDLARGEQTATALEANLTSLESKLDELLASFGGSADAASAPVANDNEEKGSPDGQLKGSK